MHKTGGIPGSVHEIFLSYTILALTNNIDDLATGFGQSEGLNKFSCKILEYLEIVFHILT